MVDRDARNEPDLDDWFDEPDTSGAWEERSARAVRSSRPDVSVDDWVAPAPGPPPRERPSLRDALRRRSVAVAALLVVCLLAGLAAAGVFSGGHTSAEPPTTQRAPATTATTPATTQTSPAPAAPTAPLKPGDTGASVKALQRALARLGFGAGAIDGQYGPSTTKAVASFQRARGLTADGVVGPKTLAALTAALATG
jgi:hypothetical protein